MTYKKQHDAQQEEANLSPAEQADRQAWDNALADPASEALLKSLVAKGMQGEFEADQAGAPLQDKEN